MSKIKLIATSTAIVFIALPLLAGCGGGGQTPEQVTQAFIDASNAADKDALQSLVTKKTWEFMGAQPTANEGSWEPAKVESATVGAAVITEDTALVPVTGEDGTAKYMLRKEDGAWKLHGIKVEMMPGSEMTMDFEKPEEMFGGAMGAAMGDAMGEAMKEMGEGMEESMKEMMEEMQKSMQEQN